MKVTMNNLDEIKKEYVTSDVVSGEFIHSLIFDGNESGLQLRNNIQAFLDWDDSPEEFELVRVGSKWIVK